MQNFIHITHKNNLIKLTYIQLVSVFQSEGELNQQSNYLKLFYN